MSETAMAFFDACETGKGWDGCQAWCHADASFACQAATLAEISTLKDYTNWMAGLLTPVPDLTYEIAAFATDAAWQPVYRDLDAEKLQIGRAHV